MRKTYTCTCVLGHSKTFRILARWRSNRFFNVTHLHPEVEH